MKRYQKVTSKILFVLIGGLAATCLLYHTPHAETVRQLPQRIVSQTLASDEILLAICPTQRIAAVSSLALNPEYSNVVSQAHAVRHQVTSTVEPILGLNPDLIIVASYSRAETVQLLTATGAPVLRLTQFNSLETIEDNINLIGAAIGAEKQATALIQQMHQQLATIRARRPQLSTSPRVVFFNQWYYTAGRATSFDAILRVLNAVNIPAQQGIQGYVKINPEQLIAWQPDFIVTEAVSGEFAQVRQRLLDDPAVRASIAAKPERIIVVEARYLSAVSQYIVKAIEILANHLYKE